MSKTTVPTSAQPIKGLSKHAQEMVKPRRYGPPIAPRYQGEIPQSFRTAKTKPAASTAGL